jgi:uncharacterized protein (TIGR02271 family)
MSIEKRIVGTYNSEQEVLYAIEGLKRQGHRETDMMVVAENRSSIPMVTSQTGVMVEADMQVSTLAGVMMNSYFSMLTGGMGGSQANSLSGRLAERGLPEYTAKQCEEEINKGKIILLVDTNGAYDNSSYQVYDETEAPRAVRLREEQLDVIKERVQVGELQVHKDVVEEQRTIHVPLLREEVYVERRPVVDGNYDGSPFTEDEMIRIPIIEERIEVTKTPVIVEEVIVGKRKIQETKQVQDTIRKEEARIERSAPLAMQAGISYSQQSNFGQEENKAENSNILVVEGNPDMENILSEIDKDEPRAKRTGSLNVTGEKNKLDSSASKKAETSGTQTDSPALKKNESKSPAETPLAAAKSPLETPLAAVKEEAMQRNEDSSTEKDNKNNKNNKNQPKKSLK